MDSASLTLTNFRCVYQKEPPQGSLPAALPVVFFIVV